jgi:hypothetical protein
MVYKYGQANVQYLQHLILSLYLVPTCNDNLNYFHLASRRRRDFNPKQFNSEQPDDRTRNFKLPSQHFEGRRVRALLRTSFLRSRHSRGNEKIVSCYQIQETLN